MDEEEVRRESGADEVGGLALVDVAGGAVGIGGGEKRKREARKGKRARVRVLR